MAVVVASIVSGEILVGVVNGVALLSPNAGTPLLLKSGEIHHLYRL